jgi:hypothetical protein
MMSASASNILQVTNRLGRAPAQPSSVDTEFGHFSALFATGTAFKAKQQSHLEKRHFLAVGKPLPNID